MAWPIQKEIHPGCPAERPGHRPKPWPGETLVVFPEDFHGTGWTLISIIYFPMFKLHQHTTWYSNATMRICSAEFLAFWSGFEHTAVNESSSSKYYWGTIRKLHSTRLQPPPWCMVRDKITVQPGQMIGCDCCYCWMGNSLTCFRGLHRNQATRINQVPCKSLPPPTDGALICLSSQQVPRELKDFRHLWPQRWDFGSVNMT